jgi:hypothetical protein
MRAEWGMLVAQRVGAGHLAPKGWSGNVRTLLAQGPYRFAGSEMKGHGNEPV